jgi:hypothetical protein
MGRGLWDDIGREYDDPRYKHGLGPALLRFLGDLVSDTVKHKDASRYTEDGVSFWSEDEKQMLLAELLTERLIDPEELQLAYAFRQASASGGEILHFTRLLAEQLDRVLDGRRYRRRDVVDNLWKRFKIQLEIEATPYDDPCFRLRAGVRTWFATDVDALSLPQREGECTAEDVAGNLARSQDARGLQSNGAEQRNRAARRIAADLTRALGIVSDSTAVCGLKLAFSEHARVAKMSRALLGGLVLASTEAKRPTYGRAMLGQDWCSADPDALSNRECGKVREARHGREYRVAGGSELIAPEPTRSEIRRLARFIVGLPIYKSFPKNSAPRVYEREILVQIIDEARATMRRFSARTLSDAFREAHLVRSTPRPGSGQTPRSPDFSTLLFVSNLAPASVQIGDDESEVDVIEMAADLAEASPAETMLDAEARKLRSLAAQYLAPTLTPQECAFVVGRSRGWTMRRIGAERGNSREAAYGWKRSFTKKWDAFFEAEHKWLDDDQLPRQWDGGVLMALATLLLRQPDDEGES